MNVMMLLEMAAQGYGDRVAFTNANESLTYRELYDAAGAAALEIKRSGCSYVAMLDVASLAMPVALFASAWAGVTYVPINYRLTAHEIKSLLERIEPALLITESDRTSEFSGHEQIKLCTREHFLSIAKNGDCLDSVWSMDQEDIGVLLFTSGTTGAPKAAVLRQKHLVSYILGSVEFGSAGAEEASLSCVPPYHIAGISAVLSSVFAGRRVVQQPNFAAEEWLELVANEKVSNAFVVPTMLAQIVEVSDRKIAERVPNLRAIAYGGGKMPLSVIEKAIRLFPNTEFTNAYGLTETSSTISVLTPEDHRVAASSAEESVRRRLISVGRALPGIEIQIRDDEGNVLAAGQRGEIYVRGEQVSGEYVGRGSSLDNEGWFPTRDAGSMDEEGYLFLEGRADDVIVRGGENMSPGEIEDVLLEHSAILDVAVVGIPDEQWGEGVAAAIVLKSGEKARVDELQQWVKSRMRSSRVPQLIEFWPELPYNETGKLLRRVVKARLAG